ncbi:HsdM family class I SAM-dependent methyltransferase [Paenibacillus lautus]
MLPEIHSVINLLSSDIKSKLPSDFETLYYSKMSYSDENKIINLDKNLLYETISFEIAFIHIALFIFNENLNEKSKKSYLALLNKLDEDNLFSWYFPTENFIDQEFKKINTADYPDIYSLLNQHDKLIHKDIKKKLGQFYTPVNIAQRMIHEISDTLKILTSNDKISDPACGTGVFLVEIIKLLNRKFSQSELLYYVNNNIFAFDVNPFAILATKINILYTLVSQANVLLDNVIDFIYRNDLLFPNIKWKNTIIEEDLNEYTIILGNPPYFKLNNKLIRSIGGYEEIIYGQPNIYSFFMYWGIQHLKRNGAMSFIVPQSIRSGLYFKNLRAKMYNLKIKSMIYLESRQNIFDRVEQAVLIICLEKKPRLNTKTKIQFYDSNGIVNAEFKIPRSKLMMDESHNNVFVISKKVQMYDILEKIYSNTSNEQRKSKFSTGLFVWNQHKDNLVDLQENAVPIIYGGNIQPLRFDFSQCSNNKERKQFALVTKKNSSFLLSGKRLLVQRTASFEKDIRLKACVISDEFIAKYPNYFLENHVNFMSSINGTEELIELEEMYFYLGLLNSKLFNYIFTSKCGNTQVSSNELNSIPVPIGDVGPITDFVASHINNIKANQTELDILVCNLYGLTVSESDFIINY